MKIKTFKLIKVANSDATASLITGR